MGNLERRIQQLETKITVEKAFLRGEENAYEQRLGSGTFMATSLVAGFAVGFIAERLNVDTQARHIMAKSSGFLTILFSSMRTIFSLISI